MKYEIEENTEEFRYSSQEMQAFTTAVSHDTINFLYINNYISKQQRDELLETTIMVAVSNNSLYGKIKKILFNDDPDFSGYKFVVATIPFEVRK